MRTRERVARRLTTCPYLSPKRNEFLKKKKKGGHQPSSIRAGIEKKKEKNRRRGVLEVRTYRGQLGGCLDAVCPEAVHADGPVCLWFDTKEGAGYI